MDLEKVAAVIRPRQSWAAIDLGFSMVRAWWRPVFATWLVTVVPVWIVLSAIFGPSSFWAIFLVWWLRPLFDRVPLHVVSRTLFGAPPTIGQTLRHLPRLWAPYLFQALVFYRFDPARSFNLPVWQLEGLRGSERWNRSTLLQREGWGSAVWLIIACRVMNIGLVIGLLGLLALFVPDSSPTTLADNIAMVFSDEGPPAWFAVVLSVLGFVSFTLIEPFYVAGGFSLYLNRRTRLEGWDVELAFRRLSRRLARERRTAPAAAPAAVRLLLAAVLGAGLVLHAATPARAQVTAHPAVEDASAEDETPEALIQHVLQEPEFQHQIKTKVWRLRSDLFNSRSSSRPPSSTPQLGALGAIVSRLVAWLVMILVVLGLGWAVVWALRHFGWIGVTRDVKVPATATVTISGPDQPRDALPADLPLAAWNRWLAGDAAGALGLLYLGALRILVERYDLDPEPSFTEEAWIRVARSKSPGAKSEFFTRLTRAWQAAAYAHRAPAGPDVQDLVAGWRQFAAEAG